MSPRRDPDRRRHVIDEIHVIDHQGPAQFRVKIRVKTVASRHKAGSAIRRRMNGEITDRTGADLKRWF